jgi:ribulose-phosphate 3-epimerase
MMCVDFLHLSDELDLIAEMGFDYLHIDIMDGHYVPNFTLGPGFCKALADYSSVPMDIHLMIENVDAYLPAFCEFPGVTVSFHPEAVYHPLRSVQAIRSYGVRAGIAFDPATPVESIRHLLPDVDLVCVMTVNPGYSGQKLVPQTLGKITELRELLEREGLEVEVEVDGNVSWENIPKMVRAGADTLVVGTSALYERNTPRREAAERLKELIRELEANR